MHQVRHWKCRFGTVSKKITGGKTSFTNSYCIMFFVVGVLALSMVDVVMGYRGLTGWSNSSNIEWNLWNVSGGVPLFSDMILVKVALDLRLLHVCMGHYQKMEESLSFIIFSHMCRPFFCFCVYNT